MVFYTLKLEIAENYLAEVSSKFYEKKPKNLIAVTGTNGKSSIVRFLFSNFKYK